MPPGPESHQNPHNDSIPTGDPLACGLPRVLFHSPLPKRLGVVPAWYDLNVKLVDIEPGDPCKLKLSEEEATSFYWIRAKLIEVPIRDEATMIDVWSGSVAESGRIARLPTTVLRLPSGASSGARSMFVTVHVKDPIPLSVPAVAVTVTA